MIADVIERDDVGVLERADRARFARKALAQIVIELFLEQLDRGQAADGRIARQIHRSHAAMAQALDDLIPIDPGRGLGHGAPFVHLSCVTPCDGCHHT